MRDARANAAGAETWNKRLQGLQKLRALAEKYRPQTVDDMLGHDHVKKRLSGEPAC